MIKNLKENGSISRKEFISDKLSPCTTRGIIKNRDKWDLPIKKMKLADSNFKSDKISPDTERGINGKSYLKRKLLEALKQNKDDQKTK